MLNKFRKYAKLFHDIHTDIAELTRRVASLQLAVGRLEVKRQKDRDTKDVPPGFCVYSQWNEDGLIQWLVSHHDIPNKTFVEFGVQSYQECNTRFLLENDGWAGLVIECDSVSAGKIKQDPVYWRHPLTVTEEYVTRENINRLLISAGLTGDIGLLSIDIDGVDYWIWEAINCVSPRIVVCEYNGLYPPPLALTVPYSADFNRTNYHPSLAYWGASLSAFCHLANTRGYSLVAINSAGSNAIFVRDDVLQVPALEPSTAYRPPTFREARDAAGVIVPQSREQLVVALGDLPLVDVRTGNTVPCRSVV